MKDELSEDERREKISNKGIGMLRKMKSHRNSPTFLYCTNCGQTFSAWLMRDYFDWEDHMLLWMQESPGQCSRYKLERKDEQMD